MKRPSQERNGPGPRAQLRPPEQGRINGGAQARSRVVGHVRWPSISRMLAVMLLAAVWAVQAAETTPKPRPGWTLELVAAAPRVRHPSVVCAAPDGRVFVAEDPMDISSPKASLAEGRILCLHPDGRTTVFAEQLHAVFGMQYLEGRLFVLHNPRFSVFRDEEGVGRDRVELIEQTNPEPWALNWNDHVPANFRLAMDGFFYGAVGDKGLFGAVDRSGRRVDLQGGGVVRIRPDGTGLEVVSRGVRNILDVAVNDEDDLFTYDNTDENHWMGRVTHMVEGGYYGYPFEFIPRRPHTLWMLADYGPGAATGALAWNDDALPPDVRGNLILADFGQRNLRRVRLAREGATFRAAADELLFQDPPPDFRPVGIHETPDGRGFYICDWQHVDNKEAVAVGRLWKLTSPFAADAPPLPAWYVPVATGRVPTADIIALMAGLAHPQKAVRLTAQRALARAGGEASRPPLAPPEARVEERLRALLADRSAPAAARRHALWALDAMDGSPAVTEAIRSAAAEPDPGLARQAIRALGGRRVREAVPVLTNLVRHADASIRFEAATALGRIADRRAVESILQALTAPEPDLWPRFAQFTALNRIGRMESSIWPALVRRLDAPEAAVRDAVAFSLRETFDPGLVKALAESAGDPARTTAARTTALSLLAAIHRQPPAWKGEWWAYHPFRLSPPARTVDWEGTAPALESMRRALDDRDEAVRLAAIDGIARVVDRGSAVRLLALWEARPSTAVSTALLGAFGALGSPEFVPVVVRVIGEPSAPVEWRRSALQAAAQIASGTNAAPAALTEAIAGALRVAALEEEVRLEAIAAAGRARMTNAAPQLVALARNGPATLREAAVRVLGGFGGEVALASLTELAASGEVTVRREAFEALGALRNPAAIPMLIGAVKDPALADAALRGLAGIPSLTALDAYLSALARPDVVLRERVRRALRELGDAALPELEKRAATLSPAARSELRRVYELRPEVLAGPLFAGAGPDVAAAPEYARHALGATGDPWRGQRIFFDEQRVACVRCHAVHGWGGTVGPELTTAGVQFGRPALIEAILEPSRAVREGYQQVELELKSGESFTGIVKAESGTEVRLQDAEGRLRSVARDQIGARRQSALSLMPEGLHAVLSLEEFADLIAYLESMKADPRRSEPAAAPEGWTDLLASPDLAGWHSVEGRDPARDPVRPARHWSLRDGVLEHDGVGDHLWTDREFGDGTLRFDWRWVDPPKWEEHPVIGPAGEEERGEAGSVLRERVLEAGDSGVFVRGAFQAQANLFCYPVGSGEFWELREAAVGVAKRGFTPRRRSDRPLGQWNTMEVTVRGEAVTVRLNGEEVISAVRIPGLPARGPIGFQHEHGRLQLRRVWFRETP